MPGSLSGPGISLGKKCIRPNQVVFLYPSLQHSNPVLFRQRNSTPPIYNLRLPDHVDGCVTSSEHEILALTLVDIHRATILERAFGFPPKMAPSYTPGQRTSISQFVSFTQSKESIAAKVRFAVMISVPCADPFHLKPGPSFHAYEVLLMRLERLLTIAVQHLKNHAWNVEQAIDAYVVPAFHFISISTRNSLCF